MLIAMQWCNYAKKKKTLHFLYLLDASGPTDVENTTHEIRH